MYYLFIKNEKELQEYKDNLICVRENVEKGKTPVFNELASAKTNLVESVPYNFINAFFLILVTIVFEKINVNELLKIAMLLITNSVCGAVANYLFVRAKHSMRLNLCKRLNIEPNEKNISAMESLEYQSV